VSRGPQLELGISVGGHPEHEGPRTPCHIDRLDQLVVAAIEALGHAQDRRKPAHGAPQLLGERPNVLVPLSGPTATVVARDIGDHGDFLAGQPA